MNLDAFVIAYSDSSFTNPHEAARHDEPPECTGNFTHMGAKYWGFETDRHRATAILEDGQGFRFNHNAYHWLHLGLKQKARVRKINISTRWFTGNQVPEVSVELIDGRSTTEVLTRVTLDPDKDHNFPIPETIAEECLIRCYHEGGIARVLLEGDVVNEAPEPENLLSFARVSHVSNEHYGKPTDAVSGVRGVDYMLGWESARSGFGERALFHLRAPTQVSEIIVDTYLHRLNPPLSCHVFGLQLDDKKYLDELWRTRPRWMIEFDDGLEVIPEDFMAYMQSKAFLSEPAGNTETFNVRLLRDDERWIPLISFGQLRADTWHRFREVESSVPVTHLLYMHYPNGGIHGLRVYGTEN